MPRAQNYEIPVPQLVRNYLKNRTDFYAALLPRIPIPAHCQALEQAVGSPESPQELDAFVADISAEPPTDDFMASFGLRDLLKKPAAGHALGRTAISLEEALQSSEYVEETGFILFNHLAHSFSSVTPLFSAEAERRQTALASLLRLHDDLRYHRFPPTHS